MVVLEYTTANGQKLVDIEDSAEEKLKQLASSLKKLTSCPCNDAERARLKSQIQGIISSGSGRAGLPDDFYELATTKIAVLPVGVWNECAR